MYSSSATKARSVETTVARRAHYSVSSDGQSETITLYDGERIEGTPGNNRYRIMHFEQQLIPMRTPESGARAQRAGRDEHRGSCSAAAIRKLRRSCNGGWACRS